MGDISLLTLPDASGVNYNSGDVDYIVTTDAVHANNANRPLKNIVYRTNVLRDKTNELLPVLNAARGSMTDLDTRLDVSLNEDGTLKTTPSVTSLQSTGAATLEGRAMALRAQCPSGFLPPHIQGSNGDAVGIVTAQALSAVYPGGAQDAVARNGYVYPAIYVNSDVISDSGHANNMYFAQQPMKVNINGYIITLESRTTKFANTVITLPAAPSSGVRQDMVIIEAWKEEVEVGSADDVFFPFGNVQYKDSTVTMNGQAFTLSNTDHSGGNWPLYLATAAEHGYYVMSNDANIAKFIADPRNNVGITEAGKYFQVRYRISTLPAHTPVVGYSSNFQSLNDGTNYFVPQGQKATRPAVAGKTNANGVFIRQDSSILAAGTQRDSGAFLGGTYSADAAAMTTVSGLSLDGFVYAAPICLVHRRNQTAWAINGNTNGAVAIGGTHTSPDRLAYNQVAERDVLDLRHRVSPNGWSDYRDIYEETLQALFKGNLRTSWKQLREDADGNLTMADLNIYGTKLMRAEGIKASSFDSSWDLCRIAYCNNSIVADPDRLRNYYSDMPGKQIIYGRIPNVGADGASPTPVFAYTSAAHSLSMDAQDLAANDGANTQRPQWSGCLPDLTWDDSPKNAARVGLTNGVFFTYSGLTGDTLTITLQQVTWVQLTISAATTLVVGDTYTLSGGCVVTVKSWNSAKTTMWATFTGTTLPATGASGGHTGTGDASITVSAVLIGYGTYNQTGLLYVAGEYLGEGYDLHAGKAISINSYVAFKAGSGLLRNMPYNEDYAGAGYNGLDSIKRCWYRINGTQVLPGDGQDFHPFGSNFDPNVSSFGDPDTHTKSTGLVGFVHRGALGTLASSGQNPCVLKDGSIYKMWHTSGAGTGTIRYATSTDGLVWSSDQQVLDKNNLPGKDDAGIVSGACVIKDGATYHMWYVGISGVNLFVCHCTSADGITWGGFAATNVIAGFQGYYDLTYPHNPWVIKDGATFKMWYAGYRYSPPSNNTHSIIYCDSADGITWANATPCLVRGAEGAYDTGNFAGYYGCCVIKDGSVYKMWAEITPDGGNPVRIAYAFSTDGKNWSRPRILMQDAEGNSAWSRIGCVIKDDKAYKLWYWGYNTTFTAPYIFHAVFTMQDTANSGSSLVGVYASTGTDNYAPTSLDDVTIFYEARAMQQDFSDYAGSSPNITMDYILRYVPMEGVMTTLGTGAVPNAAFYPYAYRDFLANLRPSLGQSTLITSDPYLAYLSGDHISYNGDPGQDSVVTSGQEKAWIDHVPVRCGICSWANIPTVIPRAGTLASLGGLASVPSNGGDLYSLYGSGYTWLGSSTLIFPTPNIAALAGGQSESFSASLVEKNGALRLVGSDTSHNTVNGAPAISDNSIMEFQMIGRPLVKSS